MSLFRTALLAMLLACLSTAVAFAQSDNGEQIGEQNGSDVSKRLNPNKARPRFFIRNEFRKREDGTYINVLEPLYDLPLTDNLVLRTQVPWVNNNPPDTPSTNGLGDITNVLAYRYHSAGGSNYFLALEARWNTAEEDSLGVGNTLLAPTWFATISVPKYKTLLFPLVQTFISVDRDDGRQEVNYTVFKGRFLTRLEDGYYVFVEPLVYFDHEDDNDSTGVLEVELGRFVNPRTMLYGRPGAGVWGNTGSAYLFEWNFEVGLRYFF